jgi:hypothetical protein
VYVCVTPRTHAGYKDTMRHIREGRAAQQLPRVLSPNSSMRAMLSPRAAGALSSTAAAPQASLPSAAAAAKCAPAAAAQGGGGGGGGGNRGSYPAAAPSGPWPPAGALSSNKDVGALAAPAPAPAAAGAGAVGGAHAVTMVCSPRSSSTAAVAASGARCCCTRASCAPHACACLRAVRNAGWLRLRCCWQQAGLSGPRPNPQLGRNKRRLSEPRAPRLSDSTKA